MRVRNHILFTIGVVATVLLLGLLVRHIDGPRIVVSATAPDGTEMCIVQQCNWEGEPFTTSFVYRKPGGPWGWIYYDHQDWYWWKGQVTLDTNRTTAIFYRDGKVTAEFDWSTEGYCIRSDRTVRLKP